MMKLINIWRYSHFTLAVSSSLFILIAALTGIILSFEPIDTKLQGYNIPKANNIALANLVKTVQQNYDEVLSLHIDANGFVSTSVISMDGDSDYDGEFYIHPITGKKIGEITIQKPLFAFNKNLHRSLFIGTVGRIFIGLTSFILLFISITGSILLIKRQGGIAYVFSTIFHENSAQHIHVALGRSLLIPIVILAFSGVYLSMLRFHIIPDKNIQSTINLDDYRIDYVKIPTHEFPIFKQTKLSDVRHLEFPFSEDVADPYILRLKNRELRVHQYNGAVVEQLNNPTINRITKTILFLHTGEGSIIWSLILGISAISILLFMYSGALISIRRLKSNIKNKVASKNAEYVILLGSENGSTKQFGVLLQQQLLKAKIAVFMDDLNNVQTYPDLKQLVVLTSTYGNGEAPANAILFIEKWKQLQQTKPFQYSVVGFGSLAYEKYCGYATDINHVLSLSQHSSSFSDLYSIHNQSFSSFQKWAKHWGDKQGLNLHILSPKKLNRKKLHAFEVLANNSVNDGYDCTFTLTLKSKKKTAIQSGDLLGIYPQSEDLKREYSVGKSNNNILLSIKKHDYGLCSHYLSQLKEGDTLQAEIISNKAFHLPKCEVIMVANGTGIAPFMGMIQDATHNTYLYWGGRSIQSYSLYKTEIERAQTQGRLKQVALSFSKEKEVEFSYVQDLLKRDAAFVFSSLKNGTSIMLCGSVSMQNDVIKLLENICVQHGTHLNDFQKRGQLMMDCY